MYNSIVAGIDIGGSHITVALVDIEKRAVLHHTRNRYDIDSQGSADAIITAWCKAIEASCKSYDGYVTNLGIAMPGPFDYSEGVSLMQNQNKYDALYGINIKKALAERLSIAVENIVTTNDAACFLQGEVFGGVAQNYKNVLGLTLGTGLGSARTVAGSIEDANLWCAVLKEGIAEDYLSSRWFIKRFRELSGKQVLGVKALFKMAEKDRTARQVFHEFGQNLGTFLIPYIIQEKAEMVVLGGNIAHSYPLFSGSLASCFQLNAVQVQVKQTLLGENAALIGAASYCFKDAMVSK
jgi:glucokinase